MLFYPLLWLSSLLSSLLRFGAGAGRPPRSGGRGNAVMPILYEFEGCPFCRIAREAFSETGVSVHVHPCPKGGKRFRPFVKELGGKTQFPYFIDSSADVAMYESNDIARRLAKTQGRGGVLIHWLGPINLISSQFAVLVRLFAGTFATKAVDNEKPLEFNGAERSPSARLVRERLCAMELDYLWTPYGSVVLFDPNTNEEVSGAVAIRRYLSRTYGA